MNVAFLARMHFGNFMWLVVELLAAKIKRKSCTQIDTNTYTRRCTHKRTHIQKVHGETDVYVWTAEVMKSNATYSINWLEFSNVSYESVNTEMSAFIKFSSNRF